MRVLRILRLLSLLGLALVPTGALAEPFRLGAEDRVDVRVFGRADLSMAQKVDADGNLRLPGLGAIRVAGLTVDDVEARVAAACRDVARILEPRVTVSVIETAPVFVGGAVQSPGRYAWASDLTAAKAYALAGGAPRLMEQGGPLVAFESYRAVEQEDQTLNRLAAGLLRRSRLAAEATSAAAFAPPAGWDEGLSREQADELLARERSLFAKRRETLAGEINNLKRQSQILAEQESALKASQTKKTQQRALLVEELTAIDGDDASRRLVPVTRLLSLKRLILDVDNDLRDIERRISETKLQSAIADQAVTNIQNARTLEASAQLAEVERDLSQLRDSLEPARRRAEVARRVIGAGGLRGSEAREPTFVVRREVNGVVETIEAGPDTKIEPRDLVQVNPAAQPPRPPVPVAAAQPPPPGPQQPPAAVAPPPPAPALRAPGSAAATDKPPGREGVSVAAPGPRPGARRIPRR